MFEAYKIGIRISLINGASAGLGLLTTHFIRAEGAATRLQSRIKSIQSDLLKGGMMLGVGALGLHLFKTPLDEAKNYELAYTRFKTLNLGDVVNKQADSFAKGTQVFGASSKELMDTLRESYGMIGDMSLAKKIAPMIAELNASNNILFGDKVGKIDNNATRAIMRFIDMRGLTNTPEDIKRGLNLAQRLVTGSGGAMKFNDLEQFAKRGGTAFKAMSDDGVMMMATVMQEMGGATAGQSLMSAYQNLVAGRTTKKAMAALKDLGLADLGYKDHGTVGGKKYKTLEIQSIKDKDTLRENFPLWVMKNVIPALEKKGVTSLADQSAVVNDLLSNRNASNLGVSFATQFLQTIRDKKMVENAMGVDQTISAAKETAKGKEVDLEKKKADLYRELGTTILPLYVKALELAISVTKDLTKWVSENTELAKGLVIGFAGLAAAMAIGGTVILLTAAFKGLGVALSLIGVGSLTSFASGIAGIGTALTGASGALGIFTKYLLGVAAAATVGYGIGTGINKGIEWGFQKGSNGKYYSLGDWLYQKTHNTDMNSPHFGKLTTAATFFFDPSNWTKRKQEERNYEAEKIRKMVAVPPDFSKAMMGFAGLIKTAQEAKDAQMKGFFSQQKDSILNGLNTIANKITSAMQVNTSINIDGRKIAEVVSKHQARDASKNTSAGGFDATRGIPPAGLNYAR